MGLDPTTYDLRIKSQVLKGLSPPSDFNVHGNLLGIFKKFGF